MERSVERNTYTYNLYNIHLAVTFDAIASSSQATSNHHFATNRIFRIFLFHVEPQHSINHPTTMSTNAEEAPTDSLSDPKPSNENGSTAAASGGDASMVAEPDEGEAKAGGGSGDDAPEDPEAAKPNQSKYYIIYS